MSRKRTAVPPQDYREHRSRWTGLIHDIHHAVASGDAASLDALAHRSNAAEACWTPVAAYPRGLVCRVMARLAYAWSRQTDVAARADLTALLMSSVELVDRLIAGTEVEAGLSGMSATQVIVDDLEGASAARLPYRED